MLQTQVDFPAGTRSNFLVSLTVDVQTLGVATGKMRICGLRICGLNNVSNADENPQITQCDIAFLKECNLF